MVVSLYGLAVEVFEGFVGDVWAGAERHWKLFMDFNLNDHS